MKQFEACRIGKNGAQIRCPIIAVPAKADQMLVPAAVGNLQQAEPVAWGNQPHGFRVNGDRTLGQYARGQIFFMQINAHACPLPDSAVQGK